jgi:CheY-like chemotaxis protein
MRPTSSTILIVDHNPQEVLRLLYAFAQAGHTDPIERTGSGFDAVAQLEGTGEYADLALFPTPGLVVVDLDLDRGSGFQVLEWIQSSRELAGLPSVVLTSSRQPRDVARAYALGAHDYRVTPESMHDLCAVVEDIEAYWRDLQPARLTYRSAGP